MNPAQLAASLPGAINKTTPQLYRDCLRLVKHVGGQSPKGRSMRALVGAEFRKNAAVTDEKALEKLRAK